jgi:hypothetical protein
MLGIKVASLVSKREENMKTRMTMLLLVAVAGLLMSSVSRAAGPIYCVVSNNLMVGNEQVGRLCVWHDDDTLYIRFQTFGEWELRQTRIALAGSFEGIPQNSQGVPLVDLFPYGEDLPEGTTIAYYTMSLNALNLDHIIICAQSVVTLNDYPVTIWAGDYYFPGSNTARYFIKDIVPPDWPQE